jgi:uncharacterized protein YbaR (Trm112 family)
MENYQPRASLPEVWVQKAACPVCKGRELQVVHIPGAADQLACGDCKTTFEVEQNLPYLRLVEVPKSLMDYRVLLVGSWMTAGDLRNRINKIKAAEASVVASSVPGNGNGNGHGLEEFPKLSQKEIAKRVGSMVALGYSTKKIIEALERLGISSQQVKKAMLDIKTAKCRKHHLEGVFLWGSLILVLVVILAGIIWLFVLGGFQLMLA